MSLAVLNPNNKTDPAEFSYVVFGRLFKYNATTKSYDIQGGLFLLSDGSGFDKFEQYPEEGPLTNNPGTAQQWNSVKMFSTEANGAPYIYQYGTLSPKPNQQYGMYGFAYIGMNGGAVSDLGSIIPNVWGPQNWRATGDFNSSYNAPMYIDNDSEGTLYAVVHNMFADDQENRVVAISKSSDNGKTWSSFDRFPKEKMDEYLQISGYTSQVTGGLKAYKSSGFAVTGVDQFSYVYTASNINSTSQTQKDYFFEIFKESGQWSIREIAHNTGDKWRTPWLLQDTTGTNIDTIIIDGFQDNPRGYEIQLAKTADGQNLVLKYTDNRDDLADLDPPIQLVNSNGIDSMLTTDIYCTYRPITGGAWTVPKTVTNDIWMNKVTWIPNIIPSLIDIPIIENVTVRFSNPQNVRVINKYPYFLQNYVVGSYIRNLILFASFDATINDNIVDDQLQKPEGIFGFPVSDVNEQLMPEFKLFDISPNPVSGEASLSYNLERPSNVKIELFNALGQKVKIIRENGLVNPGYWIVNFNTNDLTIGTYYYTLTANGRAITKIMNVVR
jgi:hypothetical protein